MTRTIARRSASLGLGLAAAFLVAAKTYGTRPEAVALPRPAVDAPLTSRPGSQTAVFSGGCFWGIQAVFQHVKGVTSATSGYTGGSQATATYEQVSSGTTGHAESVRVVYDSSQVSYGQLLQVFFSVHNPTELNHQGPDDGTQYRSVVWYTTDDQKRIAQAYIEQLARGKAFSRPIVTQLAHLAGFYSAEAYHQDYAILHPHDMYIVINDAPKVADLRKLFPALYRDQPATYAAAQR